MGGGEPTSFSGTTVLGLPGTGVPRTGYARKARGPRDPVSSGSRGDGGLPEYAAAAPRGLSGAWDGHRPAWPPRCWPHPGKAGGRLGRRDGREGGWGPAGKGTSPGGPCPEPSPAPEGRDTAPRETCPCRAVRADREPSPAAGIELAIQNGRPHGATDGRVRRANLQIWWPRPSRCASPHALPAD
ncbi:hypothetical protein B2J93_7400 [Marssonina coronariae]|uniref:Uncharacterized protein n=1 Tax=Diplocarpon coronariae TaxID=2795749 RepID=A0A218Z6I6_9HELO|nr:hypothetical protein B2J93_7400 [Marssonina coronariae]